MADTSAHAEVKVTADPTADEMQVWAFGPARELARFATRLEGDVVAVEVPGAAGPREHATMHDIGAAPPERLTVVARMPQHQHLHVNLTDSPVLINGRFGNLDIVNMSGGIAVADGFDHARIWSLDGDLDFARVTSGAFLYADTGTGAIHAKEVLGNADLATRTGPIRVDHADPLARLWLRSDKGAIAYAVPNEDADAKVVPRTNGPVNAKVIRLSRDHAPRLTRSSRDRDRDAPPTSRNGQRTRSHDHHG